MASDTDTKSTKASPKPASGAENKARWFRVANTSIEFDQLLDMYWGGPERRITGITLKIIAVNALALLTLMFGILYLGQYQNSLISARLQTFQTELEIIAEALSTTAATATQAHNSQNINIDHLSEMLKRLSIISGQRIELYDQNGKHLYDSLKDPEIANSYNMENKRTFKSVQILKDASELILKIIPNQTSLPIYKEHTNKDIPQDVFEALDAKLSLTASKKQNGNFVLSAAAPIVAPIKGKESIIGAILITRTNTQIEEDISGVWSDVLKIFAGTLIITILMSIYLSGAIARPLKKLADSAESVRKGQATANDIPDFSNRHDEIGDLSIVLRQMTSALWDRMDSTEQFAADVSHELKNPLTSLRSAIETLSIVKKDKDRKKLMEVIHHDIERLERLITDISNASRIDSELSKESFKKIEIKALLKNLLQLYAKDPLKRNDDTTKNADEHEIETTNAHIKFIDTTSQNLEIWGIESRLAQVFENLLSNALSFSPKDGLITIRLITTNNTVGILIDDQGPGIPENKRGAIFERFYSQRPEHEDYGRHSGLGLSISKQIIDAHGGELFAENIKPHGARFTVILKRA